MLYISLPFLQDFELSNVDALCDTLKQLSTESHKYHAKKDRRNQKSSFREILRSVQVGFIKCYPNSLIHNTWSVAKLLSWQGI